MRLEPRHNGIAWRMAIAPFIAVLASLAICSILIAWAGASIPQAYTLLIKGAAGSAFTLNETLTRSIPLILTGLAAAVAFRAKFFNIGGEGQLYAGALAATYFGTGLLPWPAILLVPSLIFFGAIAGGLLLLVPVLLKTRFQVDEVVTTLLLNFVVLLFVSYLIEGPWRDPMAMGWPQAAPITDDGLLPRLFGKGRLHGGLILAIAAAIAVWFLIRFTRQGFAIRATGHSPRAARFLGFPVNRTIIVTAMLSGGLAGMAGVSEVAGLKGYLTLDLSPGFGYTGIAVAMLAQLHPLAVIPSAIFLSGIYVGADSMSRAVNIPAYIADVIVGVSVLAILVTVMLANYRIRWRAV